jgi:peptide/nickel transport system substrate-binding protein
VQAYEYNLDKAREYKERALSEGAPMGRAFEMHTYSNAALSLQVAQVFQADLAQIGIDLKIVNSSWSKILTDVVNPDTAPDLWAHWVSAYFVDPENWVGHMYDSRLHGTWKAASYYKNDRVDEVLQKARVLATMEQRVPLYEDAIRQIVADSPDIWVYNSVELRGLNKRVGGFRFSPVGGGGEIRWMRLEA